MHLWFPLRLQLLYLWHPLYSQIPWRVPSILGHPGLCLAPSQLYSCHIWRRTSFYRKCFYTHSSHRIEGHLSLQSLHHQLDHLILGRHISFLLQKAPGHMVFHKVEEGFEALARFLLRKMKILLMISLTLKSNRYFPLKSLFWDTQGLLLKHP